MLAFRITKRAYADLDGLGGRYADGRWHTRPRRVVYLGSSLALASLEILVNLDLPGHLLPRDYVAMRVELPDNLPMALVDPASLPADWRLKERRSDCQALGNDWLDRAETALLKVPSAVIPLEHNLLLNPSHPDAARIPEPRIEPFSFDPRILALLDAAFG